MEAMDDTVRGVSHHEDRSEPRLPVEGLDRLIGSLRWAHLRLVLRAEEALSLPAYAGSTFRGAFGHAFKRVACPLRRQCEGCAHRAVCVCVYVFETEGPGEGSSLARGRTVAHPFVLEPPETPAREIPAGATLELGLVLIGRAISLAPYFLAACRDMAREGLGRGRGRCRLERVLAEDPESPAGRVVYDGAADLLAPAVPVWSAAELAGQDGMRNAVCGMRSGERGARNGGARNGGGAEGRGGEGGGGERVTLEFVTPTRLRQDADLVVKPEFATLATALLRRLSVLAETHCGHQGAIQARELLSGAADVTVATSDLRWHDWERYSARQGTRMTLGGFLGRITFAGPLEPWWRLLRLGEVLHVGKGTAFGLGKYRMVSEG